MVRPRLDVAETALRQVADLGFRPSDVRHIVPTHLDLDHAGGIGDFPDAAVHVFAAELRAASHRSSLSERSRYRAVQIAEVKKWAPVEEEGESWFGFSAVRAIPGTRDEVLLVPLPGHTRGHCGVAIKRAGRLAAPLRRRLFPSLRSRGRWRRRAEGLALVRVDGGRRRRRATRQSGALARTRTPWARRSEAHLLARHGGFRRDEERGAGSSTRPCASSSASAGRRVARGGASQPSKATLARRGDSRFPARFDPRERSISPRSLCPAAP